MAVLGRAILKLGVPYSCMRGTLLHPCRRCVQVGELYGGQKLPCLLYYTQVGTVPQRCPTGCDVLARGACSPPFVSLEPAGMELPITFPAATASYTGPLALPRRWRRCGVQRSCRRCRPGRCSLPRASWRSAACRRCRCGGRYQRAAACYLPGLQLACSRLGRALLPCTCLPSCQPASPAYVPCRSRTLPSLPSRPTRPALPGPQGATAQAHLCAAAAHGAAAAGRAVCIGC